MRSARVILGVALIAFGLMLSFVFPIMSIVPNMIIEYPPSNVQGDGATFSEGKYIYQEFRSDIHLKFDSGTDRLWIGMWRDEAIQIPAGYGIIGRVVNKDPGIQDGDFLQACFNIDIDQIPTDNPGYIRVRWIDDTTYPHGLLCEYLPSYGHSPAFLELEIGKTYRIWMFAIDATIQQQYNPDNAVALPGVFWQWSTIGNDGDSGESSGAVRTYFDKDLSFGISSGTYEEVETDDPSLKDDTPPIDDAPVSVGAIFVGAIFFAFGAVILLIESNLFEFRREGFAYPAFLIVIWILAFTILFYLSNNQTFWWEWLF